MLGVHIPVHSQSSSAGKSRVGPPSSSGFDRLAAAGDELKKSMKNAAALKCLEAPFLDWLSTAELSPRRTKEGSSIDEEMASCIEILAELEEAVGYSLFRGMIDRQAVQSMVDLEESVLQRAFQLDIATSAGAAYSPF